MEKWIALKLYIVYPRKNRKVIMFTVVMCKYRSVSRWEKIAMLSLAFAFFHCCFCSVCCEPDRHKCLPHSLEEPCWLLSTLEIKKTLGHSFQTLQCKLATVTNWYSAAVFQSFLCVENKSAWMIIRTNPSYATDPSGWVDPS